MLLRTLLCRMEQSRMSQNDIRTAPRLDVIPISEAARQARTGFYPLPMPHALLQLHPKFGFNRNDTWHLSTLNLARIVKSMCVNLRLICGQRVLWAKRDPAQRHIRIGSMHCIATIVQSCSEGGVCQSVLRGGGETIPVSFSSSSWDLEGYGGHISTRGS